MPRATGAGEEIWQPQYDTEELDSGTLEVFFFKNPVGQTLSISGTRKTFIHTNMVEAGVLPRDQLFEVFGLRMWLFTAKDLGTDAVETVIDHLQKAAVIELDIGQKNYLRVPFELCPGGVGIQAQADSIVAGFKVANNGMPDPRAVASFQNWPVKIARQQPFGVNLSLESVAGGLTEVWRVKCALMGKLTRAVQ